MAENVELRKHFGKYCKFLKININFFIYIYHGTKYLKKDGDKIVMKSKDETIPEKPRKIVNFISKLLFL